MNKLIAEHYQRKIIGILARVKETILLLDAGDQAGMLEKYQQVVELFMSRRYTPEIYPLGRE